MGLPKGPRCCPTAKRCCRQHCAQVITVTPETAALEALVLMARENIAGVGVVNNLSGALIGNFSFSDLRCALPLTDEGRKEGSSTSVPAAWG